eukprot:Gregarina_sp_Poly_1__7645@NODE_42_length_18083_cov_98_634880_g36_i0_p6_GENE_NODE_42_length_18083_cov_98_634880_g36_i0NODE_42_length_18083_cov_98_634880_g36_i0_p6_ORF_typecomplete_len438_score41_72OTU/PF02338_19/5_9e03OTU/PF02338_19/0_0042Peptidase_C65/PF10275_9/0_011_NODE_42_length_18083_cov_98_634880_g36_i01615417467
MRAVLCDKFRLGESRSNESRNQTHKALAVALLSLLPWTGSYTLNPARSRSPSAIQRWTSEKPNIWEHNNDQKGLKKFRGIPTIQGNQQTPNLKELIRRQSQKPFRGFQASRNPHGWSSNLKELIRRQSQKQFRGFAALKKAIGQSNAMTFSGIQNAVSSGQTRKFRRLSAKKLTGRFKELPAWENHNSKSKWPLNSKSKWPLNSKTGRKHKHKSKGHSSMSRGNSYSAVCDISSLNNYVVPDPTPYHPVRIPYQPLSSRAAPPISPLEQKSRVSVEDLREWIRQPGNWHSGGNAIAHYAPALLVKAAPWPANWEIIIYKYKRDDSNPSIIPLNKCEESEAPGNKVIHLELKQEHFNPVGLTVAGDGNCFYRSVYKCLTDDMKSVLFSHLKPDEHDGNLEEACIQELRNMVADTIDDEFLEAHEDVQGPLPSRRMHEP